MSVLEDQSVIEASLGGRIDRIEMQIFAEELAEYFEEYDGMPFYLLLDYSKAASFDEKTVATLNGIKDHAVEMGAAKVFSVPQETDDLATHVQDRIQQVLEGREEVIAYASQAKFAPLTAHRIALAA